MSKIVKKVNMINKEVIKWKKKIGEFKGRDLL